MLDVRESRSRQQRLLPELARLKLDAVVVRSPRHLQYLSIHRPDWKQHAAFILFPDGKSWLATANRAVEIAAADDIVSYDANWMGTLRSDQPELVARMATQKLVDSRSTRIGVDWSAVSSSLVLQGPFEPKSIDSALLQMRRVKKPDQLRLMRRAINCTEAMYAHARQIIEPGISELRVFNELHAAAMDVAGEALSAPLGNDFACGVGGELPRAGRVAEAGELYILDLGPAYRGSFADNCRAISVDRKPSEEQQEARNAIIDCLKIVESMAKPGARCNEICQAVDQHLKLVRSTGMRHHLGHGAGLEPHEFPRLNPKWDDVLLEGEVFTAEPGQYGPELRGGIRIENQYLVTHDGVECLTRFPTQLA